MRGSSGAAAGPSQVSAQWAQSVREVTFARADKTVICPQKTFSPRRLAAQRRVFGAQKAPVIRSLLLRKPAVAQP